VPGGQGLLDTDAKIERLSFEFEFAGLTFEIKDVVDDGEEGAAGINVWRNRAARDEGPTEVGHGVMPFIGKGFRVAMLAKLGFGARGFGGDSSGEHLGDWPGSTQSWTFVLRAARTRAKFGSKGW
jgi:hypothetical protein